MIPAKKSAKKTPERNVDRFNRLQHFESAERARAKDITGLFCLSLWIYSSIPKREALIPEDQCEGKKAIFALVLFCLVLLLVVLYFWSSTLIPISFKFCCCFFFSLWPTTLFYYFLQHYLPPAKANAFQFDNISKEINSKVTLITLQEVRLNVTESMNNNSTITTRRSSEGEKRCWLNKLTQILQNTFWSVHRYTRYVRWHAEIEVASATERQPQNKIIIATTATPTPTEKQQQHPNENSSRLFHT